MRDAKAVCRVLHEAGVRRIWVYGDSFARHIYVAMSIITSDDFSRGGLDDDEQGRRECCGAGQFSWKACRMRISTNKTVCGGNIMIIRQDRWSVPRWSPWPPSHSFSAHDLSESDLILLSEGRFVQGFPALFQPRHYEPWFLPYSTPARSPWEADRTCGLTDWDAIDSWVKAFCRPFRYKPASP